MECMNGTHSSPVCIPTSYRNVLEPISERARLAPDARILTLIREDGTPEHLSAGEIDAEAQAYAGGLQQADLRPGDVVILAIGPLRPLIGAFLGAVYAGAVPTISSWATDRLDPTVHRPRVAALVQSSAARAIVSTADRSGPFCEIVGELGCQVLNCEDLRFAPGAGSPDAGLGRLPDDIAFLQYSSGTGGRPKGVPHTHRRVLRYLEAKRQVRAPVRPAEGSPVLAALWAHDVIISWLPLYHDLGLVSGLLTPLVLGVHGILMSPQQWVRDPKILFRAIHQYRGTLCYMPNFALNHCVLAIRDRDLQGVDLSHWHELLSGGEPVRWESLRLFAERFAPYGFRESALRTGYGMAELVEGATTSAKGDPPHVDWIDRGRLQRDHCAVSAPAQGPGSLAVMSCGRPMPGTELRIVDERDATLPDRCVGEIDIRSEYMFSGYYLQPDLTARAFRDGWFRSGDLGYLADGELYITGRQTDLIIVSGRNIQPEDLEQIADKIPGLRPGRSVAFGVPDALLGSERIVMVCEILPDCDAGQRLTIERQLRRQVAHEVGVTLGDVRWVPRGWIIKTSSGKTTRPENRRKFLEQFGDGQAGNSMVFTPLPKGS
jgi:fatty-acyl-CoA synthase